MVQVQLNVLVPIFQIQNESSVMTRGLSKHDLWNSPTVLLSTALLYVRSVRGEFIEARSIFDSGSMRNLITNELADLLCTTKKRVKSALNGVSGTPIKVKFKATATNENKNKKISKELDFLITSKITNIIS